MRREPLQWRTLALFLITTEFKIKNNIRQIKMINIELKSMQTWNSVRIEWAKGRANVNRRSFTTCAKNAIFANQLHANARIHVHITVHSFVRWVSGRRFLCKKSDFCVFQTDATSQIQVSIHTNNAFNVKHNSKAQILFKS